MKKAATVIALALTLSAPISQASAEPSAAPTVPNSAQEQYRIDFAAYQDSMRAREAQVRTIFTAFNASVNKAKADYQSALASAKAADAKYQAKVAYKVAIQNAADQYDAAVAALGPVPVPPQKPMKIAKTPMLPQKKKG